MTKYLTVVLFACMVWLASCSSSGNSKEKGGSTTGNSQPGEAGIDYLHITGDSVLIPSIAVDLHLSEAANNKLQSLHESVLVTASFSGLPKDTGSREFHEWGELPLLSASVELQQGGIARFEGLKFPKLLYDSLSGKDISVLIHVRSTRRSTPNNLLDAGIVTGKISLLKDSILVLPVRLIAATDSLPG